MTKSQLIFRDIVFLHHPEFVRSPRLRKLAQTQPEIFNVERLVELCMSSVGGYDFLDADGYDFSDWSDSKTATIGLNDSVAVVGNILGRGKQGELKVGDLRVVLYNPFKQRLDYYFMPKAEWDQIRESGEANKGKLRATYNPQQDTIYKWKQWQCDSFEQLALKPSTVVRGEAPCGKRKILSNVV